MSPTDFSHGFVGKLSMTRPMSSDLAMGYAAASITSTVPPHLGGPHQHIHKACLVQTSIACDPSVPRRMNIHLSILQQANYAAFRSLGRHSCPTDPHLSVNFELNSSPDPVLYIFLSDSIKLISLNRLDAQHRRIAMDELALYDGFDEDIAPPPVEEEQDVNDNVDERVEVERKERRDDGGPRTKKQKTKPNVEESAPDLLSMEYGAYLEAFAKIKSYLKEQVGRKKRGGRGGQRRGGSRRS